MYDEVEKVEFTGLRAPNLMEVSKSRLEQAKKEVVRLTELIQLLEDNPNTQRIIELMGGRL